MKPIRSDVVEEICSACSGTGFLPMIKQPGPGKRINPPRCARCDGKGRLPRPAEDCLGLFSPTDERLTTPIYLPTYLDNLLEIARRLEATDICRQGKMPDPCKGWRGQELNPLFATPMSTSLARFSGSFCS